MKTLYVDVRGDKDQVFSNLQSLSDQLEKHAFVEKSYDFFMLQAGTKNVLSEKLNELLGNETSYAYAEFSDSLSVPEQLLFLQNMALFFNPFLREKFPTFCLNEGVLGNVRFDKSGTIVHSPFFPLSGAEGKNLFHFFLSHLKQDTAGVLFRDGKLEYVFDVSVFEKTPKNAHGKNQFLGKDLIAFHGESKNFGKMLGELIKKLFLSFSSGSLDMLVIDLLGAPHSLLNEKQIRRFERDFVLPVRNGPRVVGMMAFADVFFQDVSELLSPYEGGLVINGIETQKDVISLVKGGMI